MAIPYETPASMLFRSSEAILDSQRRICRSLGGEKKQILRKGAYSSSYPIFSLFIRENRGSQELTYPGPCGELMAV